MKKASSLVALSIALITNTAGGAHAADDVMKARVEHNVSLARQQMSARKFTDAVETYRRALQAEPQNANAHAELGMALAKQFKLDGADYYFNRALDLDPYNATAYAGKALAQLHSIQSSDNEIRRNYQNILRNAEELARKAIMLGGDVPEAHFVLGSILKEQMKLDEALQEYDTATRIDPKYAEAYAGAGMVNLLKNDLPQAAIDFQRAIGHDSSNASAHFGLGTTLFKQQRYSEAIHSLNTSLALNPNSAPAQYMLGECYKAQGNATAAVKAFQESIRIKPENPDAYMRIADVREQRGDLEHALAELRSAKDTLPNNWEIRQRLADIALKLEKADDAIKEYSAVLAAQPNNSSAKQGLTSAYNVKAQKEISKAFFNSNNYDGAQKAITEAIKLNPNDFELRLAQTKLRKMAGILFRPEEAVEPQNEGDRIGWAESLMARGKFREAFLEMDGLIKRTKDPRQLLALGDVSLMIKDLDSAEAAYQKASAHDGSKERAERGLVQVAKARDEARQDLAMGNDLASHKQWQAALDKFYSAMKKDPRDSVARKGVAKVLERLDDPSAEELRESVNQWRAYINLEPAMPPEEREQLTKKIAKLENTIAKLEERKAARAARAKEIAAKRTAED